MAMPLTRAGALFAALLATAPAIGQSSSDLVSRFSTPDTTGTAHARPIEARLPLPLSAEGMHRFVHGIPARGADASEATTGAVAASLKASMANTEETDDTSSERPTERARKPGPRTLLQRLTDQEAVLVARLKKVHTAPALYDLALIRLAIAREKRKAKTMRDVQYRQYLLRKAAPLLKLNLGRRGRQTHSRSGSSYAALSLRLLEKIMAAVKSTVTNLPNPRSRRDQHGIATFYGGEAIYGSGDGPEFHGRHTRSGDMYCMFGQTAAYMRAPLGSWIRVLHNRSGRFVDVRVNDTGPFEDAGKLIDLSRGAYKLLRMRDRDTVSIRRIKASEAIPEPLLCRGRGSFNLRTHLFTYHPTLPYAFTTP